ncbi:DUF6636 domain-containing protein [Rhodococcoides kyotonense]|uniref:Lipoprotein n=1 Tax=Rhodococcoides kyotonense TaxID=398843 RepID=A0A239GKW9_9NOCA|nr:DUF6636 domain-containing protein [Rhodococcus kyotonensis]SNS68704.1 hypothetical protein SAMN05421642_104249 [Rhodococcus kyotonensis]
MVNKRLAVAGIFAAGVLLAGCGSESGADVAATSAPVPTTTASSAAPTTTTEAPVTTTEAPVPTTTEPAPVPTPQTTYAALDGAYYFSSPDGQFQCGIVTLASRTEAGCQGVTDPVPPRPEDCMISWGNGIRVTNEGEASFMCAGGAVYTSGGEVIDPPLGIGQTIAADGYTCTSAADGISCGNDETGHGFRIAPDSNEVY